MKKDLNVRISCICTDSRTLSFYGEIMGESVWLFDTRYFDQNVYDTFRNGVTMRKLVETDYRRRQTKNSILGQRLQRIKDRSIQMLKWYEKEYETAIFRKSGLRFAA